MQSSFRRTRRSNAIDVLWNEVGFFLRAFRNLRNPPFYPRASCLFAFHRPLFLFLSLPCILSLVYSFSSLAVTFLIFPFHRILPCGVDEKVSALLSVDALRNPATDSFTVGRNRKAALLSNDGAIPSELRRRLVRYIHR